MISVACKRGVSGGHFGGWRPCGDTTCGSLDGEDFSSGVEGGEAGAGGRVDKGAGGGGGGLRPVDGGHSRCHVGAVDHGALKNCSSGRGGLLVWLVSGLLV